MAKSFQFQVEPWDCDPTQIYNCLSELRRRQGPALPEYSLHDVRGFVPAALEGSRHLRAVASLKQRLAPFGYTARSVFGSVESSWAGVVRVLKDESASFPMIGVSGEYWGEVSSRPKIESSIGHSLILLRASDESATLFDSYFGHLARSGQLKSGLGASVRPENAVVEVPMTRLITYWSNAHTPRYCFWVERIKLEKVAGQRVLTQDWDKP